MVHSERRQDGGLLALTLDQPKGNIISRALIGDLSRALTAAASTPGVRLVTIEGAGDHFSYGASVEEHRPALIREVLPELHALVYQMLALPIPTAAIVRGRCLGGGLEVVLACDLVFAGSNALMGVPEIMLGVFPPAAAALLPLKVGVARAAGAVLTGQARPAAYWQAAGLIELVAEPAELTAAVAAWYDGNLAARSGAALGHAALAARRILRAQVETVLPQLEADYLDRLMQTHDAVEGITAFIEKRPPVWRHQ